MQSLKKKIYYIYSVLPASLKRAPNFIIDDCESPCGCWERNSGRLEERPVLLAAQLFLQPRGLMPWERIQSVARLSFHFFISILIRFSFIRGAEVPRVRSFLVLLLLIPSVNLWWSDRMQGWFQFSCVCGDLLCVWVCLQLRRKFHEVLFVSVRQRRLLGHGFKAIASLY